MYVCTYNIMYMIYTYNMYQEHINAANWRFMALMYSCMYITTFANILPSDANSTAAT